METLLKADIFFFISSVAVLVLTVFTSVLLYYLIKAGKNLHMLSEALKKDFKDSEEFIEELKERFEKNIIFRIFFPPLNRRRRATAKEDTKKDDN